MTRRASRADSERAIVTISGYVCCAMCRRPLTYRDVDPTYQPVPDTLDPDPDMLVRAPITLDELRRRP